MRLTQWILPFGVGAVFALTADTFAQDAGLYSSAELGRRSLPGEAAISDQLLEESRALDARERSIAAKEELLRGSETRLRDQVAGNQRLRDEIVTLLERLDAERDEEISRQIKVYEKMRGTQAAPILSEMDEDIVLPILRGMRADKAAKILAAMTPKVAANLSERLNEDPAAELSR